MDEVKIKREKRLRRAMLEIMEAAKASGWIRGRMIADILDGQPDGIEGDAELMSLGTDLVNLGLAVRKDLRTLQSQRAGLDYLAYEITARGTGLLAGTEPVCGLVADERI